MEQQIQVAKAKNEMDRSRIEMIIASKKANIKTLKNDLKRKDLDCSHRIAWMNKIELCNIEILIFENKLREIDENWKLSVMTSDGKYLMN